MNEDCEHKSQLLTLTTVKSIYDVEQDEGVWFLVEQDFREPDGVQVEISCPDCGRQRLLDHSEWEVS